MVKGVLYVLTGIAAMAGALVAYWFVHEVMGYYGRRSVTFYIAGMFAGGSLIKPLWMLHDRRNPPESVAESAE